MLPGTTSSEADFLAPRRFPGPRGGLLARPSEAWEAWRVWIWYVEGCWKENRASNDVRGEDWWCVVCERREERVREVDERRERFIVVVMRVGASWTCAIDVV